MNRRIFLFLCLCLFPNFAFAIQAIEGKVIGTEPLANGTSGKFNASLLRHCNEIIKIYPKTNDNDDNDLIDVNAFAREMLKLHPNLSSMKLILDNKFQVEWKKEETPEVSRWHIRDVRDDEKWFIRGLNSPRWFPVNLEGEL
jgi:hypothetical protein